jgi:hypothetical protein
MTQISGKLVKHTIGTTELMANINEQATIELPTVDFKNVKEGDDVWLKIRVKQIHNDWYFAGEGDFGHSLHCDKRYLVAHFPKQEEPKAELPEIVDLYENIYRGKTWECFGKLEDVVNKLLKVVREQQDTLKQMQGNIAELSEKIGRGE